jgi:hypothetical protein
MADIINAFNDCIERLQRGETLGDCLRHYPEFAGQLRPMLETALLAGRVQVNPHEVSLATDHIRKQVATAIYTTPIRQRRNPFSMVVVMAAILSIVFFGGYLTSQLLDTTSESPGQQLPGATSLREVRQMVDNGQLAEVRFEGIVTQIQGTLWQIEDVLVTVPPDTVFVGQPISEGGLVRVEGYTTPRHELFAMTITLLESDDLVPVPTATVKLCLVIPSERTPVAVRSGGGTGYRAIGQLNVGETLTAIGLNEANNTWYAVQYDVATTGWVSSTVTTLNGNCDELPVLTYAPAPQTNAPVPTVDNGDSNNGGSGNPGPGTGREDEHEVDEEDEDEHEADEADDD